MKTLLERVVSGNSLSPSQIQDFFQLAQNGHLHDTQIAAFLTALQVKGVESEELLAAFTALQSEVPFQNDLSCVHVMGTGKTKKAFNVTTAASLLASAKMKILKQVSPAIYSSSGSLEIVHALGLTLADDPFSDLESKDIAFSPSSFFHPIFEQVEMIRRSLQVPTLFDLVAPLLTLTLPKKIFMGVYSEKALQLIYHFLEKTDSFDHILCIFGASGIDEFSLEGDTLYVEKKEGVLKKGIFSLDSIDLTPTKLEPMKNSFDSSEKILSVLEGIASPYLEQAALTTGAIFYIDNQCESLTEGYFLAKKLIASGEAKEKYRSLTHQKVN